MLPSRKLFVILLLNLRGELSGALFDQTGCAPDADQTMPEGPVKNIGRFPWLGIVQYSFNLGGVTRFAVTTGVLIHPTFVLAPASDIAKIPPHLLQNNTQFVVWDSSNVKYAIEVKDYSLHPEYSEGTTLATLALLELYPSRRIGSVDVENPLLPICLNLQGAVAFSDFYTVRMMDERGEIRKEAHKMNYVSDTDCDEFYNRAGLGFSKMKPTRNLCVVSELQRESCVWDAGTVLITRQSWGYWKLIGFGVRGAGCGAPSRFVFVPSYLDWIEDVISMGDVIEEQDNDDIVRIHFRRLSPVKLAMYKGDTRLPTIQGQCDREIRGNVMFKDGSELLVNKNFVQGFYFVSVTQMTEITCAIVTVDSIQRTNAAVWVEHHCHREYTGFEPNMKNGPDLRKLECFMYFKSKTFLDVRFYFSFRALIELTLYGHENEGLIGNPFDTTYDTEKWEPTTSIIRWGTFFPYAISAGYL